MDFITHLIYQVFAYSEAEPIIFTRLSFWIFFTVLLVGYLFIYNRPSIRNLYLLLFSLYFYYKSSGLFIILLIFSTVANYLIAFKIAGGGKRSIRKWWVALSIFINLLMLSYFKYSYFIIDLVNSIFSKDITVVNTLAVWSNSLLKTTFDVSMILLPVGISFYSFQIISYTVDVYRKKVEPLRNFVDFAFYVSFFPQLVAGPIVRAAEFIPQLRRKYSLTFNEFGYALFLILAGLVKKMVISDYISISFVDRVFDSPLSYSGFENLMAMYGYALQIYCDFSGYTDIAIGIALVLGFRLPVNFNSPYKATSITDFWHRWHISLSTWLRDYLYISLGGNRKGKLRTNVNLMITMLLGGLWHGANLKFIVWGGIHGVVLVFEKLFKRNIRHEAKRSNIKRFISFLITFHVVCFAWIFFRAENFTAAIAMIRQIFTRIGLSSIPQVMVAYSNVFWLMLIGFVIHWLPYTLVERVRGAFIDSPVWVKGIITIAVAILIVQFQSSALQPFIYFRF